MSAKILRSLIPLLASALCLACEPGRGLERHELLLALPEAPASWACLPELVFDLSWRGEDGRAELALARPGDRLRISVERGAGQSVLARPRSGDASLGRYLRPAGALYPEGLEGGESYEGVGLLRLDWIGGYAASLWRELEDGGLDPAAYDLSRLVASALEKGPDPWTVEPLEAARRLASSSFRIGLYAEAELFPVSLPGSPWASESPFAPSPGAEPSSPAGGLAVDLGSGLWRFLGPDSVLLVSVDAGGGSCCLRLPR